MLIGPSNLLQSTLLRPTGPHASGTSYTGPGDVVAFTSWCGLRAYSNATASPSTKAATVYDLTDDPGALSPIDLFLKTDGTIDISGLNQAHSIIISALYDQTGNGNDLTNATPITNGPPMAFSVIGSNPSVQLQSGGSILSNSTGFGTAAQPWSLSAVYGVTSAANFTRIFTDVSGNGLITRNVGTSHINAGSQEAIADDFTSKHSYNIRVDDVNTTSKYSLDGAAVVTVTPSTNSWAGAVSLGSASNAVPGNYFELGFKNATISDANLVNIANNQATFYGAFPQ